MKLSTRSRAAVLSTALAGTLVLTACGASNETEASSGGSGGGGSSDESAAQLSGDLVGAGASSQQAAMEAWQAGFEGEYPDVQFSYDPVGSGGGREQFISGATDFAGSDAPLDEEELPTAQERCGGGEVFQLPNTAITPVHRGDDSGTTDNFTHYLFQTAGDVWTAEPDGVWPLPGGEAANGTSGVVEVVTNTVGAVTYADASRAGDLGVVSVGVGEEFVAPSAEAAAAVVENSPAVEGRGEYDFAIEVNRQTEGTGEYPIVLVSYHIGCVQYDDQATADNVQAFMQYVISEDGQQAAAENAGNAPISETLREQAQTAVDAISAG